MCDLGVYYRLSSGELCVEAGLIRSRRPNKADNDNDDVFEL
jgi:hypothetical protein